MLKPFYNKKKNIDNRLLPLATAADAGRVVGVDEEGHITLVDGGGGSTIPYIYPITITPTEASYVCDKTLSEIEGAIDDPEKIPVVFHPDDNIWYLLHHLIPDEYVVFQKASITTGTSATEWIINRTLVTIYADGSVAMEYLTGRFNITT